MKMKNISKNSFRIKKESDLKTSPHKRLTQECFSNKRRIEQKSLNEEKKELKNSWAEWLTLF
jgi:hypothetical protein